jgi:hypothetical protein
MITTTVQTTAAAADAVLDVAAVKSLEIWTRESQGVSAPCFLVLNKLALQLRHLISTAWSHPDLSSKLLLQKVQPCRCFSSLEPSTMRNTMITFITVGSMILIGCETKSPPGGPGADNSSRVGTPDNAFTISVDSISVKQGESKTVTVSINRGKNFNQDVKLDVSPAPSGVTIKFDNTTIHASAEEVHMTVAASKDAALGEHTIKITATPEQSGAATAADVKVEVNKP